MALTGKNWVLLHMPRTGGTWMAKALAANAPRSWGMQIRLPTHMSYEQLKCRGAKAAIFVRNPWDWAVSYYRWGVTHADIQGNLRWGNKSFGEALEQMHSESWFLRRLTDGAEQLSIGRFEDVRGELIRLLGDAGFEVSPAVSAAILKWPPCHCSSRRPYRECYGERERELVAEKDRDLIGRFGYSF
jgi:hypothetical protein